MTNEMDRRAAEREATQITRLQIGLLALALALVGAGAGVMLRPERAQAQSGDVIQGIPPGPGGFLGGRGPMMAEQPIVSRFDRNKDGRLDAAERATAREWLATSGGPRRGFGGRGGRGMAASSPGRTLSPADVRSYPEAPLYDLKTLRTIFLQFDNPEWEQELAAFYRTDVEVPATVVVDGKAYKDVGVGFRGASSFMMVPEGSKRSLNLSFDFVHENQALNGYRTINLLNANGDPTFLRPVLYAEIARAYIPAAKTNFVRVVVNGESWGVYVNSQQFNKDFLRDFYGTDKGARWKVPGSPGGRGGMEYLGEDIAPYKQVYEIKSRDDARDWADLIQMFRVLNQTAPEQLEAALSPLLDIDGALRFLALDVALVNSDGYWTRASDYHIYKDAKGRFHVLPHDMNEAFAEGGGPGGRGGRGFMGRGGPPPDFPTGGPVVMPFPPGGPPPGGAPMPPPGGRGFGPAGGGIELDPLVGLTDATKPLRSKLLAVPALRERYLEYVRDIAVNWLDWQKLEPMVNEWRQLIAEEVKLDTRKLYPYEAFESGISGSERSLQSFVERRRQFLLNVTDPKARAN